MGRNSAATLSSVSHFGEPNIDTFGGRYSPNVSLLSMRPVLQFSGPVLFRDCPRGVAHLQLFRVDKAR